MAAGLVEKAARLSGGHWIGAANVGKRAAVLRRQAATLVDADAAAYTNYIKAVRAAKGLHTVERELLLGAVRDAIVEVPLKIVRSAAEVTDLAGDMALHGNPNLRPDAMVAAQLSAAAARSAQITLAANMRPNAKDKRLAEARLLTNTATERARRLCAPVRAGGRDRAPARSRGSGRP